MKYYNQIQLVLFSESLTVLIIDVKEADININVKMAEINIFMMEADNKCKCKEADK